MLWALAAVWIGMFEPAQPVTPCRDCTKVTVAPRAGEVRVLTSADSPAASGDVVIANPLVGMVLRGRVDQGRVHLPWFNLDRRDGDDGVLVLPGDANPVLVTPSALDVLAIKQAMLRDEVLSHVKRAVDGTEIGALDLDGDGRADLAVTYGCNAWGDGACQSHGQFFLVRRGQKWFEID